MDRGYAKITVQSGSGVFAFASVIDNVTNDPTTVAMQTSASASVIWVPVASHAGGLNSSQWRTDLGLLNTGTATANVQIQFFGSGGVVSNTTSVAAGAQSILTDVVGQLGGSGSGALEITSDQPLEVTSRTYNQVAVRRGLLPERHAGPGLPGGGRQQRAGRGPERVPRGAHRERLVPLQHRAGQHGDGRARRSWSSSTTARGPASRTTRWR